MARIEVVMPQMGESIAEGTVSKWLKRVGDPIKRDEPLFEISTDKVDAEIPAPAAGVLAEIRVREGETVPVETPVGVIETDVTAAAPPPAVSAPAPAQAPAEQPVPTSAAPATASPASPPRPGSGRAPAAGPAGSAPTPPALPSSGPGAAPPGQDGGTEDRLRQRSTPLVRKIAAEHQVDLAQVPGTGVAGRVTKEDLLGYIASAAAAPKPALPPGAPAVEPWPGDRVEPFSRIRKITADHMLLSRRVSAHVTSFFEVDFGVVAQLRQRHRQAYADLGVNLTYLAFIAKACAEQLRRHPIINAAVASDSIIYRQEVNVGIAVALEWGLIVPVIKRADELSLQGLARAIGDLSERARSKKLTPDEVQRGTFTITNPGVFGSYAGAPIINQPQVAILDVGAIEKRPKVVTAPDGSDAIAIRPLGILSLSYDHRVVDGADADRFLADVRAALQTFPEGAI